ncbi:MAG: potassium-transporting ATPase subunit KdpA [Saprospiraceae bacterium]|nr:potassium-transporting ATPase subunit KdpA [Candidatus Opimibacter skivensis]
MNTEILGIVFMFGLTLLLAIPFGRYIAKVYHGEKSLLDFMAPVENLFYRISGINAQREMTWKESMVAMLTINMVWFLFAMFILMAQGWLPLNPDGNPSMTADLAFNTAISFMVNCNLQHYSGETGVTYLSQLVGLMFLQFVSAATGLAAAAILFNALKERTTDKLGNFYNYFVKSLTRILLPLSVVVAIIFLFNGMPMTLEGKDTITSMQGDTVQVSTGPVAAFVPIKHLGTNGGGYFGTNSAHPFENPNYLTNIVQQVAQFIIPLAMVFALGFYLKKRKFSWMVFGVMTVGFLCLVIPNIVMEQQGNPQIAQMGVDMSSGAMEGKEVRFGAAASAYWSILTTVISTGSVNSFHDSFMPLSGMNQMLAMMVNGFYGGVGVGMLNFFVFVIIAVFISGLMVGRTPELFGKKVEAREVKIAVIVTLMSALLIKGGTAIAAYMFTADPSLPWLNNPGFHGFSEMLYEFTSANANNGSGFEGLGDNNPFWNISTGIVLILGRFIPIIGPIAIAGILANKKYIPESAGTLRTDNVTFGIMIFAVIFILTALSYFPALALGPIAEFFSMH